MDPNHDVRSLQRKVQWDIPYYFARRGAENVHAMLKDHFEVMTDQDTGLRYVKIAKDEETKNNKEIDQDIITGFMPEMRGDKMCPVTSYLRYINALSPRSEKLWQILKFDHFPTDRSTTYYYGNMGHNKLDSFVSDVCKLVGTPKYTNHCLRVTAVTNLSRENYSNKQIMSITGHKSSSSLEIYQKVNASEKLDMGQSLAGSLTKTPNQCKRKSTSTVSSNNQETNKENIELPKKIVSIPDETDPDFNFNAEDILQIVEQCERSNQEYTVSNVNSNNSNNNLTMTSNVIQERSPNVPSFSYCKIGNITFNIQK